MRHILHCLLALTIAAMVIACGNAGGSTDKSLPGEQTAATKGAPAASPAIADTPTSAYKRLFAAVKAKNTDAIKAEVSKKTQSLALMLSQRNNKSIEKSYENGFTATTFAESLPDLRDERINGVFGAIEVWNHKESKWEDLPFILEEGSWKLAVGEIFDDTYKSPGPGLSMKERQAANSQVKRPPNAIQSSNVGNKNDN